MWMRLIVCLLFIVVVLDPRFKLQYVKYYFSCVYDVETITKLTLRVEKALHQFYAFYNGRDNTQNTVGVGVEKRECNMQLNVQGTYQNWEKKIPIFETTTRHLHK